MNRLAFQRREFFQGGLIVGIGGVIRTHQQIVIGYGLLIGGVHKGRHQGIAVFADGFGSGVFDPVLLDSDIDNVRHVVGQVQVRNGLDK